MNGKKPVNNKAFITHIHDFICIICCCMMGLGYGSMKPFEKICASLYLVKYEKFLIIIMLFCPRAIIFNDVC